MRYVGFEPLFDENSRVLILGSFPSVKSREEGFYYGNKLNRFWKMISLLSGKEADTVENKKNICISLRVALWDIVCECEIEGSMDKDIRNYKVAPIEIILDRAPIKKILLNGSKAYEIFTDNYPRFSSIAVKMPSTSSANVRFDLDKWKKELNEFLRQ